MAILARRAAIASWVAWSAGGLAVASVAISLVAVFGSDLGFAAFLALLVWIAATSFALLSRSRGLAVTPVRAPAV